MASVFLFAHQDDEVFILPSIKKAIDAGQDIHCFYLTNGCFHGANSDERNHETLAVLKRIGVPQENIHFVGTQLKIPDGYLHQHVEKLVPWLNSWFEKNKVDHLFYGAWEGGHIDHDTAFIIGNQLTKKFKIEKSFQFFLYNGEKTVWKFFRVLEPLPGVKPVAKVRLTWKMRVMLVRCLFSYPSQKVTWIGLAPEFLLKIFLLRSFKLYQFAKPLELKKKPLYQRMGRGSKEEVLASIKQLEV